MTYRGLDRLIRSADCSASLDSSNLEKTRRRRRTIAEKHQYADGHYQDNLERYGNVGQESLQPHPGGFLCLAFTASRSLIGATRAAFTTDATPVTHFLRHYLFSQSWCSFPPALELGTSSFSSLAAGLLAG